MAAPEALGALANGHETASPAELHAQSPAKPMMKIEGPSSPPPLIEDRSSVMEDGEIADIGDDIDTLRTQVQPPTLEYSALEDRFKKLQRQHSELQDLASAYREVIQGFPLSNGDNVSIDQMQLESGREGLRAKALEADILRPLVREAGGLQALISQTNSMRLLIDKAGGLRELEQFVSDLRSIRDTLDELKGSHGLAGLASEVRNLLVSRQIYAELQSEVDGSNGLRAKAARYEKLMQAFKDVQGVGMLQSVRSVPQAITFSSAMNPARAQMISATPIEADPDRDLYEAHAPVAKPNNKTGSNNTPLGIVQAQPAHKRKAPTSDITSNPVKRPRVDIGRASALVQATLHAFTSQSKRRDLEQSNVIVAQARPGRVDHGSTSVDLAGSQALVEKAAAPLKMSDWMQSDIRFAEVGSTTDMPSYSSTPPAQGVRLHEDARSGPVRFLANAPTQVPLSVAHQPGNGSHMALQPVAAASLDPRYGQLSVWKDGLKHAIAFRVGNANASAAWNNYQSYELKRSFQVPGDLLTTFALELYRCIPMDKYDEYETMVPSHDTCVLGYMIDGHRPSGSAQERVACSSCTQHRRPCALLQDIDGIRTIIFMPLRNSLRNGIKWSNKAFWVQGEQSRT